MTPEQLVTAVIDLLDAGVSTADLARARRRGPDLSPADIVRALGGRLPLGAAATTDPHAMGADGSGRGGVGRGGAGRGGVGRGGVGSGGVGSGGVGTPSGSTVLVCGASMPRRLGESWGSGGPLWVHHRGAPVPDRPAVAIVGTRRPTVDGLELAERLAADLAGAGVLVVSGLARGIDQAAHRGALRAGGPTTAVIGTGHGVDYPGGSRHLRQDIAGSGGILSEYPDGHGVRSPSQFLARNRILAGLADGVVVIEAGIRSGALSTAGWGADLGRPVMVVPSSPSNPAAAGALELLSQGATPVRHAADVLAVLGLPDVAGPPAPQGGGGPQGQPPEGRPPLDRAAQQVRELLGPRPSTVSQLAQRTGLGARSVLVAVSVLEERGLVRRSGDGIALR